MAAPQLLKAGRLAELGASLGPGPQRVTAAEARALLGAEEIVAAAEARAAAIVEEAARLREEERRRGYEEGLAEGRAEVLRGLLAEQADLDRELAGLEAGVAATALTIARAVIGEVADPDLAASLAARALHEMRRERRADLRVAPALAAELRARLPEILEGFPEVEVVDVIEDGDLEGASVILESRVGRVEADLERVLARFEDGLARTVRDRAAPGGES